MENFAGNEKINRNIVAASHSQSSSPLGERESASRETHQQGETKSVSSETLRNLVRAFNDPNVSIEVKKRIGYLLRQLQQRYLERVQRQTSNSSTVTESFQAAVTSGVVSRLETERQKSAETQRPNLVQPQQESFEKFPSRTREEAGKKSPASLEFSKRITLDGERLRDEKGVLFKTSFSQVNGLGFSNRTDPLPQKFPEPTGNNVANIGLQIRSANHLSPSIAEETRLLNGRESYNFRPPYQSLKEAETFASRRVTSGMATSSQVPVSSSYSDKSCGLSHETQESFPRQWKSNNTFNSFSVQENKSWNSLNGTDVVTNSATGSGSSSVRYKSSSSSLERKRSRLLSAPQRDLENAFHPNYKTPFESLEDAYQRLMPYHLWYVVENGTERKQEWEDSFQRVYKKLRHNLCQQEDRWKRITQEIDSEQVNEERTRQHVMETTVLDEILAANFLLKET
ncbi:hypothetical protein GAYE_SCF08G3063 [Galdieria yellowstonensis]|uniref:GLTSCR protein conserved domain-containing protein n=1 Tax=Galdieria yellowstonensis TaxID=3028027 RepID=A0AAV9ICR6_9RHOD|nr:hypothetical protein GAYE_SCF08G3063 [Galdieria yellowstonensis]